MTTAELPSEALTIAQVAGALLETHRDMVRDRIADLQRDLAAVTDKITTYRHLETHPR
jgi:hypothetical protein